MRQIGRSDQTKSAPIVEHFRILVLIMVRPVGLEPTTPCSEDKCSNPLSYGRTRGSTSIPS